jgi:hypothetical protein
MSQYPAATTGLGVAANILVAGNVNADNTTPGYNIVKLSLSASTYPTTLQLNPELVDVSGAVITPGTAYTLSAVAAASAGTTVYTGTFTGATTGSLVGQTFVVTGFVSSANNGTYIVTANSGTTTVTLDNANGVAVTAAGVATSQEAGSNQLTYVAYGARNVSSGQPSGQAVATVSASGLITAQQLGSTTVEVSYPTFNNAVGDVVSSGNIMNGLPINKVYALVDVFVLA